MTGTPADWLYGFRSMCYNYFFCFRKLMQNLIFTAARHQFGGETVLPQKNKSDWSQIIARSCICGAGEDSSLSATKAAMTQVGYKVSVSQARLLSAGTIW